MNLDEALYARLSTYAGLIALTSTRIYPMELPQTPTLPAITYYRVNAPTEHVMGETISDIERATYRIQCWGATMTSARAVADQVIAALDGFKGLLGGALGVRCWITRTNSLDLDDPDTSWMRRILDFELWNTP